MNRGPLTWTQQYALGKLQPGWTLVEWRAALEGFLRPQEIERTLNALRKKNQVWISMMGIVAKGARPA